VFPNLDGTQRQRLTRQYEVACRARKRYACAHLAALVASRDQAMPLLRQGCGRGDMHGCHVLARHLGDMASAASPGQAGPLWRKAVDASRRVCRRGHAPGCRYLATLQRTGAPGQGADLERAAAEMGSLCRKGSSAACREQRALECGPGGIKPDSRDCKPPVRTVVVKFDGETGLLGTISGGVAGGTLNTSPMTVSSHLVEKYRKSGRKDIAPDRRDRAAIRKSHAAKVLGIVTMCLDVKGRVTSTRLIRSTGYPRYDRKILREMGRWRFRPIQFWRKPTAVCTTVKHVYPKHARTP